MKTAYFAGGCFWCITAPIATAKGVLSVVSGYSGGEEENPTYLEVKHQQTGHREAIRVDYEENILSYEDLLSLFFENIDPFDDGGQFIDRGHSYTTAIFYETEDQLRLVKEKIAEVEKAEGRPVCVSVEPFKSFYPAEEEHQDYYKKNPEAFEKELVESGRKRS